MTDCACDCLACDRGRQAFGGCTNEFHTSVTVWFGHDIPRPKKVRCARGSFCKGGFAPADFKPNTRRSCDACLKDMFGDEWEQYKKQD